MSPYANITAQHPSAAPTTTITTTTHHHQPQQPFPFTSLPTELRLIIYSHALIPPHLPLLRSKNELLPTYQRGELIDSEYPPPPPKDPSKFNFAALPPRLKALVQAECYANGTRAILTSRDELLGPPNRGFGDRNARFEGAEGERKRVPLADTGLLRVSKGVCGEAKGVFYGGNRFHYSIAVTDAHRDLPAFSRNRSFLRNLPLMRYVSLDLGDCIDNFWREHYSAVAEKILPIYLQLIETHCMRSGARTLKTLDLAFMSLPADDSFLDTDPGESFNDLLVGEGHTSRVLRGMKGNIGMVSVVGIGRSGERNVLKGFCGEVAGEGEWRKERWGRWRGKKLDVVPVRRGVEVEPYLRGEGGKGGEGEEGEGVHCWRLKGRR